MSLKRVKIEIPVSTIKNSQDYMILYRNLIYNIQRTICPKDLYLAQDSNIETFIDLDLFSKRLGFICFKLKSTKKVEELKAVYTISNNQSTLRWIKSGELETEDLEVLGKDQLLFMLPSETTINFELTFEEGSMNDHARFSLIEGYRFNTTQTSHTIEFETIDPRISTQAIIQYLTKAQYSIETYKTQITQKDEP